MSDDQRSRPQNAGGSRVFPVFVGGFVALIGLGFCIWLIAGYLHVRETYQWTETPCEITNSWIEKSRFSKNSPITYELKVNYRYTAAGADQSSDKIRRRGSKRKQDKADVEDIARKYAIGTRHTCFVNPDAPDEAVLQHDSKAVGYVVWFPGLFVVGGIGMIVAALRRKS